MAATTSNYGVAPGNKEHKNGVHSDMKRHTIISLIRIIVLGTAITSIAAAQQGTKDGQWLSYGGDKGSTKYAPLDQIARDNFSNLEIAWQGTSIDADLASRDDCTRRPGRL